ncbi:MAG: DUF4453 domain-containing protein [Pseudomonadota bacterium]
MPRIVSRSLGLVFGLSLGLLALMQTARADPYCLELWFDRNAIFDRAGYCFNSSLGKTVFDNSDCISQNVQLSGEAERQVGEIRREERANGCGRPNFTSFDLQEVIPLLRLRWQLEEWPRRDIAGSACIGYNGPQQLALRARPSTNSRILGTIEVGDDISYNHYPKNETWSFVTTRDGASGQAKALGWFIEPPGITSGAWCRVLAG